MLTVFLVFIISKIIYVAGLHAGAVRAVGTLCFVLLECQTKEAFPSLKFPGTPGSHFAAVKGAGSCLESVG